MSGQLAVASPRARTSPHARRRATAVSTLSSVALLLLTACGDAPTGTGPLSAPLAKRASAGGAQLQDPLSTRLASTPGACIVATRTDDGGYVSRNATVRVPQKIISSSRGRLTRFAYRGWAPAVDEPLVLAVCTVPDSPTALAYFRTRFGADAMTDAGLKSFAQSAGVAVQEWDSGVSPHVMQGASPVYMTDGLASEADALVAAPTSSGGVSAMMIEPCDETAILVEDGCEPAYPEEPLPEEETVPEEPPPPTEEPEFSLVPDPNLAIAPAAVIYCEGSTDYPHRSTTTGFVGRINVKSHNRCPVPLPQYVTSTLKRQKCFLWIFCSWATIAFGANSSPSATFITAMANTGCSWQNGWYRGYGYHQTTFPQGIGSTRTASFAVGIRCW